MRFKIRKLRHRIGGVFDHRLFMGGEEETASITPKQMADALHAVMEADRTVYAKEIVNRLQYEEKVIKASEHWKDDKALPLPAQFMRLGADLVAEKTESFSYALLSLWPVNNRTHRSPRVKRPGSNTWWTIPTKTITAPRSWAARSILQPSTRTRPSPKPASHATTITRTARAVILS